MLLHKLKAPNVGSNSGYDADYTGATYMLDRNNNDDTVVYRATRIIKFVDPMIWGVA